MTTALFLILLLLGGAGSCLLVYGCFCAGEGLRFLRRGVTAAGQVTGYREHVSYAKQPPHHPIHTYIPQIRFSAGGREHTCPAESVRSSKRKKYAVGQPVSLRYLQDQPDRLILAGDQRYPGGAAAGLLAGCAYYALAGYLCLRILQSAPGERMTLQMLSGAAVLAVSVCVQLVWLALAKPAAQPSPRRHLIAVLCGQSALLVMWLLAWTKLL